MNNLDFPKSVYDIINSQDELKILVLKESTISIIKNYSKVTLINYLYALKNKPYFHVINNPIYKEVNKQNLKILREELKILSYLNKNINKMYTSNDKLYLTNYLELIECFYNINQIRIEYIKENSNIGRMAASTHHLKNIEELLEEKNNLKKQLI
jgi:hypothetical protein